MSLGLFQKASPRASQTVGIGLSWTPCSLLISLPSVTECNVTHDGRSHCACLSGYQWNASVCSHCQPCQTPIKHRPCSCLVLSPTEAGYCQLLPPGKEGWELGNQEPRVNKTLSVFSSLMAVSLPAGPSPAAPLGERKCQVSQQITGPALGTGIVRLTNNRALETGGQGKFPFWWKGKS